MSNPYTVLGVESNATDEQIKSAYRRKCKDHHPDREQGDEAKMLEVRAAYDLLKNPERRALFDKAGITDRPPQLTKQATELIVLLFRQYILDAPDDTDAVPALKVKLDEFEAQQHQALRNLREQLRTVESRKNTVKLKPKAEGENIYSIVIDNLIQDITRAVQVCELKLQTIPIAREILDQYKSKPINVSTLMYGNLNRPQPYFIISE
jgi:curved DNA-binding protein CbpA